MREWLDGITWFRGSSVRIRGKESEIHVDPSGVNEDAEADLILLTHPHFDNFSEADIARVRGPDTVVVAPSTMKKQLTDADHFMRPGDLLQVDGFDVLAVPAHNVKKKFHTPADGWLGYVFTVDGTTFYHAGDTDYLPSMDTIRCDIAFLPCDGYYTMSVEEAVRAAEACGAQAVVPVHWGELHGTRADIARLETLFPGEVWVLEREGSHREGEGIS
jgi:L-ascorbate metabolism protein UlaG (beta-lactamase superfamily)